MDGGAKSDLPDVYPFIEYNGWTYPAYPCFIEDPGKHCQNILNFDSRVSDVLLCSAAKTGTHWFYQIVSMLMDHTTDFNTRGTVMDAHIDFYSDYSKFEKQTNRRLLQTHFPYNCIPKKHKELGGKIIYLNRNPKDRLLSQYRFFSQLHGFPENWIWDEFLDEFMREDKFRGGWFMYTKEFTEAQKTHQNILPVTYEDMKLYPMREIKRIAEFLDVDTEEIFLRAVKDKTSFNVLKDNVKDGTVIFSRDSKPHLFRKGEIGEWKEEFTVAQSEELDSLFAKELNGLDVKFIYDYPDKQ